MSNVNNQVQETNEVEAVETASKLETAKKVVKTVGIVLGALTIVGLGVLVVSAIAASKKDEDGECTEGEDYNGSDEAIETTATEA